MWKSLPCLALSATLALLPIPPLLAHENILPNHEPILEEEHSLGLSDLLEQTQGDQRELHRRRVLERNLAQAAHSAHGALTHSIAQSEHEKAQAGGAIRADAEWANALGAAAAQAAQAGQQGNWVEQVEGTEVPQVNPQGNIVARGDAYLATIQGQMGVKPIVGPVGLFLDQDAFEKMNTKPTLLVDGTTTTTDAFGFATTTVTVQRLFTTILGKKVVSRATLSVSKRFLDGSQSDATTVVTYSYSNFRGIVNLISAKGTTTKAVTDADGFTRANGTMTHTFTIKSGRPLVTRSQISINVQSLDGDVDKVTGSVKYAYNPVGQLTSVTAGPAKVISTEASGYTTTTTTVQEVFTVVGGKAKLSSLTGHSVAASLDGSSRVSDFTRRYTYDLAGRLTSITAGPDQVVSMDAFGFTRRTATIQYLYTVINGLERLVRSVIDEAVASLDGSSEATHLTIQRTYDPIGRLVAVTSSSATVGREADGATFTVAAQQGYTMIHGQARLTQETRRRVTSYLDGSSETIDSTDTLTRDAVTGRLVGIVGADHAEAHDPFHFTADITDTRRTYKLVGGQAKLDSAGVHKQITSVAADRFVTDYTLTYAYGLTGRLVGVTSTPQITEGSDAFGTIIRSTDLASYTIILGQIRLAREVIDTVITDFSGSTQVSHLVVVYTYDAFGRLIGVSRQ